MNNEILKKRFYAVRPRNVAAIRYTGDNGADVVEFLTELLGKECGAYTNYLEYEGFTIVQFYAWNDDQEVDPNRWVVIPLNDDYEPDITRHGEIMYDDDFEDKYVPYAGV